MAALFLLAACSAHAQERGVARGDNGRTGSSPVGPGDSVVPAWEFDSGPVRPAWALEARGSLWQKIDQPFVPRAADDLAPVPVITSNSVVFGTTLDGVFCLDRDSGRVRWRRWMGGPVRYAPVVAGNQVLVGADDGMVRALDLSDGSVRWERPAGKDAPWLPGNGRLVSPTPVRTGLLESGGTVFAGVGLFPLEGTWLVALQAADGTERWRENLGNASPQGYLVEAGANLIVPNGRAAPRLHRRVDGVFRRSLESANGTLAVASGDDTFSGPGATGSFAGTPAEPAGAKVVSYPGRHLAVTPATSCLVNEREILLLDRAALRTNRGDLAAALRWKASLPGVTALAVAGPHVVVGRTNAVSLLDSGDGREVRVLPAQGTVAALAVDGLGIVAATTEGRVLAWRRGGAESGTAVPRRAVAELADEGARALAQATQAPEPNVTRTLDRLGLRRGWGLWTGKAAPADVVPAVLASAGLSWVFAVPADEVDRWREYLALRGWLGTRASVVSQGTDGSVPVVAGIFNVVRAGHLPAAEARRLVCPEPSGAILRGDRIETVPPGEGVGQWTHQYGDAANTCSSAQGLSGVPRLRWFGGHGPERMPDRHTRGHAPLAAGGLVVSVAEDGLIGTDARNGTVRWSVPLPEAMRYAMPYDAGHVVLEPDASRLWAAVRGELWEIDPRGEARVVHRRPSPRAGEHWGWVARSGDGLFASTQRATAARTRKEYTLVDLDYRSGRPLVCSTALFRLDPSSGAIRWRAETSGAWVNPTLAAAGGRVFAVEALGAAARTNSTGRLTGAEIVADARVVCLDAGDGRRLWEQPLVWPEAEDILGLAVRDGRLILSCARSVEGHARYHLRGWEVADGRELWRASGTNPIEDLYHGQQVKRPVLVAGRVSFESDLFDAATGRRWTPPGAGTDWILRRPGHACGAMTGTDDGLLFRADNPTWFRFADGSFTRLAPTRPGCWLNILPAEGGVLIPEASASCICGYPIQASMGFGFDDSRR